MPKNSKWLLVLFVVVNIISIEVPWEEVKATWQSVKEALFDSGHNGGDKPEPPSEYDEEDIETLFEEAQRLYGAQNFYKLIDVTDKIIKRYPDFAEAYNLRGIAYKELKQYDQAIQDYTKAIKLDPKSDWAYNNRGALYKALKDYESAVEDLLQAIDLNSNNYAAYANLGEICYELEEHETAILYLNKSIDIGLEGKDLGEALYYRGLSYLKLGNKKQAQSDLNTAKELGYPD